MGSATSLHGLTQKCCGPIFPCLHPVPESVKTRNPVLRHCGNHSSRGSCCLHKRCQEAELGPAVEGLPTSCRKNRFLVSEQGMQGSLLSPPLPPPWDFCPFSKSSFIFSTNSLNCPQFSSKAPARLSNYSCLNRRKEEEVPHREKRDTNI